MQVCHQVFQSNVCKLETKCFILKCDSPIDGGKGLLSPMSDVITGSGPKQKIVDFGVSGPTEFSYEL